MPKSQRRHNRVVLLLNDAEFAKLRRLADRRKMPRGTLAHELFTAALARVK